MAESTIPKAKGQKGFAKDVSDAQNMLGELCELGLQDGVSSEPDLKDALEWYKKALKNGHDRAMCNIAAIYEKGDIFPRDM